MVRTAPFRFCGPMGHGRKWSQAASISAENRDQSAGAGEASDISNTPPFSWRKILADRILPPSSVGNRKSRQTNRRRGRTGFTNVLSPGYAPVGYRCPTFATPQTHQEPMLARSGGLIGRLACPGGEGGIRTHGTGEGTTVFETAPIDHSGTSPQAAGYKGRPRALQLKPAGNGSAPARPALHAANARLGRVRCVQFTLTRNGPAL